MFVWSPAVDNEELTLFNLCTTTEWSAAVVVYWWITRLFEEMHVLFVQHIKQGVGRTGYEIFYIISYFIDTVSLQSRHCAHAHCYVSVIHPHELKQKWSVIYLRLDLFITDISTHSSLNIWKHEAVVHMKNLNFPCCMLDLAIRPTHCLNNRFMQITFRAYPISHLSHT